MSNASATFMAQIPDGMNAFQQGRDNIRVMLDIPRMYLPEAMKLMVMREGVLSVTITYEGERHEVPMTPPESEQPPRHPKPAKGPWGQFWRQMKLAGFEHCPGVREAIEDARIHDETDGFDILRLIFVVESLTTVSPDEVKGKFDFPQAHTMVDQALRKVTQ